MDIFGTRTPTGNVFVVILALLFMLPAGAGIMNAGAGEDAGSRADPPTTEVNTLSDSSTEGSVVFGTGGTPTPSQLTVQLPSDAVVTEAEFDLFGSPVFEIQGKQAHDFSAHPASVPVWGGAAGYNNPTTQNPSVLTSNAVDFIDADKDRLKAVDMSFIGNMWMGTTGYNIFNFTVSLKIIDQMEFNFVGFGRQEKISPPAESFVVDIYFWNYVTNGWVKDPKMVQHNSGPNATPMPQNYQAWRNTTTVCSEYLDYQGGSTSEIFVLVVSPIASMETVELTCDYVNLNVTYGTNIYPTNVALDIGDDGTDEWTNVPAFDTLATLNEASDATATGFQNYIDVQTGNGLLDIPITFSSATKGNITMSNITITYYQNGPPTPVNDVVNNTRIKEDSGWQTVLDLNTYFTDDIDPDELRYDVAIQGTDVEIAIDDDGHSLNVTTVTGDWFGVNEVQVAVYDTGRDGVADTGDDKMVLSNPFVIIVEPSNDGPVIQSVNDEPRINGLIALSGAKAAVQGEYYNFTVISDDIDGDGFAVRTNITDGTGGDDRANFMVGADGKSLSFLPTNKDVGILKFTVTVEEVNASVATKLTDTVDVELQVQNYNDPPTIIVPDVYAPEDRWTNYTLKVTDPDVVFGDESFTWGSNLTNAIPGLSNGVNLKFDENNPVVSIKPDNSMVGIHLVTYTVSDSQKDVDSGEARIFVNNTNDKPTAAITSPTLEDTFLDNESIPLLGSGNDVDLIHGDELTFGWSAVGDDGSTYTAMGATTSFASLPHGNYTITLIVTDKSGASAQDTVTIFVGKTGGGGTVVAGYNVVLELSASALAIRPGHAKTVTATITNKGDQEDTIIAGALSDGDATAGTVAMTQSGEPVIYAKDEAKTLDITVTIPEDAEDGTTFTVTITAKSQGSGMLEFDTRTIAVTVDEDAVVEDPIEPKAKDKDEEFNWLPVILLIVVLVVVLLLVVMIMAKKKKVDALKKEAEELIDTTEADMKEAGFRVPMGTKESALASIDTLRGAVKAGDAGRMESGIAELKGHSSEIAEAKSAAPAPPMGMPGAAPPMQVSVAPAGVMGVAPMMGVQPAGFGIQPAGAPGVYGAAPAPVAAVPAMPAAAPAVQVQAVSFQPVQGMATADPSQQLPPGQV